MNGRVLASVVRKAMVSRMSEAAVIHTIDDDESMRAGARQTSALDPDSTGGAINLNRFERPGEMGETGNSAIVPAVTDAIFAATGKRLRELPITQRSLWSLTRARELFIQNGGHLDLLRKSGEFPVSNEELDETATTVYEGI